MNSDTPTALRQLLRQNKSIWDIDLDKVLRVCRSVGVAKHVFPKGQKAIPEAGYVSLSEYTYFENLGQDFIHPEDKFRILKRKISNFINKLKFKLDKRNKNIKYDFF